MDSFESIVAMILEQEGYWVKNSFKVELTKKEKSDIGIPTSPRWELDLIAYKPKSNEILVIECKSYLDSTGVGFNGVCGTDEKYSKRYKLFNNSNLRNIIFGRLVSQLEQKGLCAPSPSVKLCLAIGKVAHDNDRQKIKEYFQKNNWLFFDDKWVADKLREVSKLGYENDVAIVVTKILERSRDKL
jgi:hypothetical protein